MTPQPSHLQPVRRWSETAWQAAAGEWERLCRLPFVTGLMQGTLPEARFVRYLQQDMIYLRHYSEEMQLLAALMPTAPMRRFFSDLATEGVAAEDELHRLLAGRWQVKPAPPLPATTGYLAFTRRQLESGSAPLAMAALLPCFWVYNELGHYIAAGATTASNPYRAWIDTYESEEMDRVVERAIDVADTLAESTDEATRETMRRLFVTATAWERVFFEPDSFTGESGLAL